MVRMDKLIDAWRTDPRADATVELCAMLIRASLKAAPQRLFPSHFVLGFAGEAHGKHPENLDVSVAIADLYLVSGMLVHAAGILETAFRQAPDDPRVTDRRDRIAKVRAAQAASKNPALFADSPGKPGELLADSPGKLAEFETLDAPTTPLDPITDPETTPGKAPVLPPRRVEVAPEAAARPVADRPPLGVPPAAAPAAAPPKLAEEEPTDTKTGGAPMPGMGLPSSSNLALNPRRQRTMAGFGVPGPPPVTRLAPAAPAAPPAQPAAAPPPVVTPLDDDDEDEQRTKVGDAAPPPKPPASALDDDDPRTNVGAADDNPPTRTAVGAKPSVGDSPASSGPADDDNPATRTAIGAPPRPVPAATPSQDDDNPSTSTRTGPAPGARSDPGFEQGGIGPRIAARRAARRPARGPLATDPELVAPRPKPLIEDPGSDTDYPTNVTSLPPLGRSLAQGTPGRPAAAPQRPPGTSRRALDDAAYDESVTGVVDLPPRPAVAQAKLAPRPGPAPPPDDPQDAEEETATGIRPLDSFPQPTRPAPREGAGGFPSPRLPAFGQDDPSTSSAVTDLREPPHNFPPPAFGAPAPDAPDDDDDDGGGVRTHVLRGAAALAAAHVDPRPPHARSRDVPPAAPQYLPGPQPFSAPQQMQHPSVARGHIVGAGASSAPPSFAAPPSAPSFGPPPSFGPRPPFAAPQIEEGAVGFQPPPGTFPQFGPQSTLQAPPVAVRPPSRPGPWKLYVIMGIVFLVVAALAGYAIYLLATERDRSTSPGAPGVHLVVLRIDSVRKLGPAVPTEGC